jgi:hypothetical protein
LQRAFNFSNTQVRWAKQPQQWYAIAFAFSPAVNWHAVNQKAPLFHALNMVASLQSLYNDCFGDELAPEKLEAAETALAMQVSHFRMSSRCNASVDP